MATPPSASRIRSPWASRRVASRGLLRTGDRRSMGGTQYWTHDGSMLRSAVVSHDEVHRYSLGRRWAPQVVDDQLCWVLLNPSTADGTIDDPTVRRCIGFSRDWGYNALVLVNLFAYRATHPNELRFAADPVGPYNEHYVKAAVWHSASVVVGWGGTPHGASPIDLRREEYAQGRTVHCLGRTQGGRPKHPLYIPKLKDREEY